MRRALLVGPGEGSTKRWWDPEDFEVIVRMNYGIPVPEEQWEGTSDRTDVLYTYDRPINRMAKRYMDAVRKEFILHPDMADITYRNQAAFLNLARHPWSMYPLNLFEWTCKKLEKLYTGPIRGTMYGVRPNMGLMAMLDLVIVRGWDLYVTGISFYSEADAHYPEWYMSRNSEARIVNREHGNYDTHSQDCQRKLFMLYLAGRIHPDGPLKEAIRSWR